MVATNEQIEQWKEALIREVDYLSRNAASRVFDGNTTKETYRRVLKGIEDGDPEILDGLPRVDWSMQWADGPDWGLIVADTMPTGVTIDDLDDEYDELAEEWYMEIGEDYSWVVIESEVERIARKHITRS